MHGLSECIASFYVKRKIIPTEHKEIYSYGIELILNEALTFILVLITGAVLKNFIGSVIFLIVFCGTRIYTGGFHANTTAVCRMTMIITASSVIIFSRLIINIPFFGNYFVSAYSCQTSKQEFDRGTKTKRKKKRNTALFDFFNLLNFPVVFQ